MTMLSSATIGDFRSGLIHPPMEYGSSMGTSIGRWIAEIVPGRIGWCAAGVMHQLFQSDIRPLGIANLRVIGEDLAESRVPTEVTALDCHSDKSGSHAFGA